MAGDEQPPPYVCEALTSRGSGPPLQAVKTRRNVPVPSLGDHSASFPLWLIRSDDGIWLVGAAETPSTSGLATDVAIGVRHPREARIEAQGQRCAVVIGSVRAGLCPSSVEAAQALIEGYQPFLEASQKPAYLLDARMAQLPPSEEGEAQAAPGVQLASTWMRIAGGLPEDPWFHASPSSSTLTLMGYVRDVPRRVWVGISEQRIRLALEQPGAQGYDRFDLEAPLQFVTHHRRPVLTSDELRIVGGYLQHADYLFIHRLSCVTGGARWAVLVMEHLSTSRYVSGLAILRAALERGHTQALAEPLALLAAACGHPLHAVSHLRQAIDNFGEQTDYSGFAHLVEQLALACTTSKPRHHLPVDEALAVLSIAIVPLPQPIEGVPWPPTSPAEIWAAAAAHSRLGPDLAISPLSGESDPVRVLQWVAGITQKPEDFRRAAQGLRIREQSEAAHTTLLRAINLAPTVEDSWLRVTWATEDNNREELDKALDMALSLDPEAHAAGPLIPSSVLNAIAERAEQRALSAAPHLIDLADRRCPSTTIPDRIERARRLRDKHNSPVYAARMLSRIVDSIEPDRSTDELSIGALRIEAARAFLDAGLHSAALAATRKAVAEDFLHADTLRVAAALPNLPISSAEQQWWLHLADVLKPGPKSVGGLPPLDSLSPAELRSLHPGETDWRTDWRMRLNTPTLPARDQLLRGLARIDSAEMPDLFQLIQQLSAAFGIHPVPAYIYRGDEAIGVSGWPTQPPLLLIGASHLEPGPRQLSKLELTFTIAVELAHLAAEHPVLSFDDSVLGTSRSVYQAFGRFAGTAETAVDLVSLIPGIDQLAKLQKLIKLSRQVFFVRKAVNKAQSLAQPVLRRAFPNAAAPTQRGLTKDGLQGTALAFRIQADRAALRLTGNIRAAIQAILSTSSQPEGRLQTWHEQGLEPLLSASDDDDPTLSADETIRIIALLEDAARNGPPSPPPL